MGHPFTWVDLIAGIAVSLDIASGNILFIGHDPRFTTD
jgi:hypothetical protein